MFDWNEENENSVIYWVVLAAAVILLFVNLPLVCQENVELLFDQPVHRLGLPGSSIAHPFYSQGWGCH